jgi:hypothetical protein
MNGSSLPRRVSLRIRAATLGALAMATLAIGGCEWIRAMFEPKPPELAFAPYDKPYASKPDFARIEHKYPLPRADLARLLPKHLEAMDQEQIDQIYARLTAGPIPDGAFDGRILLPRGMTGKFRIAEIAGGFGGFALQLKGLATESLGEALWKGKVFYRDERVLRNRIEDLAALKAAGLVEGEPRKLTVGGRDAWLLFPAKVFCGQSLLDARRESIIIDYLFTDEIAGYQEKPDFLAGRRGLRVRDEIRMVRPGFYLGRAYVDRVFLLNFTLYGEDVANRDADAFAKGAPLPEDCYTGTQQRAVVAAAK